MPTRSSPKGRARRPTCSTPRTRPPLEYLQQKGLLAPVDPSTLAQTPSKYNSPEGDWVGRLGPGQRAHLQPAPDRREPAADPRPAARRPAVQGQARLRPRRDRLPADRHLGAAHLRQGQRRSPGWRASRPTPAATSIPDNETIADEVNRGHVAFGVVNQYYWYRMRGRDRRVQHALADRLLRPARPRLRRRRLGCGDPEVVQAPGGGAEVPGLPRLQAGPGDHRPALDQLRVPDRAPGVHHARARDAVRPACSRTRSRSPSSATAPQAIALLARGGAAVTAASRCDSCRRWPRGSQTAPARLGPRRRAVPAASDAIATARAPAPVVLLARELPGRRRGPVLPLAFLLIEASGAGCRAASGHLDLPAADRDPAVEHGPAHRRRHRALRRDRDRWRPGASSGPTCPAGASGRCWWSSPSPSPTSW